MATITFLYDLREEAKHNITVDQLTSNIIFGANGIPGFYNPTKVYKPGDIVPVIDEKGVLKVYEAIRETTGEPMNMKDWTEFSIINKLNSLRNDIIVLDNQMPTDTFINKVWIQVKRAENVDIDLSYASYGLIIKNNFVVSKEEPNPFKDDLVWGHITEVTQTLI